MSILGCKVELHKQSEIFSIKANSSSAVCCLFQHVGGQQCHQHPSDRLCKVDNLHFAVAIKISSEIKED